MKIIYDPKGRAAEYADLAANLYRGCGHGCIYCYAPNVLRMNRKEFFENPQPRKNVIELFRKDCEELVDAGDTRSVMLCFTCDPFQPIDDEYQLTRQALMILVESGLHYKILTKGGARALRDFDLMKEHPELCEFGTTLVFADKGFSDVGSLEYEPYAATTPERIGVLQAAHGWGIPTWVSLEPVWSPDDAFNLIHRTHMFVDVFKIGKLNYHPQAKNVDWVQFKHDVVALCEDLGCKYVLKKDLEVLA